MASMNELLKRTASLADAWGELAADLDAMSDDAEKAGDKEKAQKAAEASAGIDQVGDAFDSIMQDAELVREGHPEVF